MKKLRGRWCPSPEQISLAIDCAVARMPIERAAALIGIGPRSLWIFAKRVGLPGIFGAWKDRPAPVGRPGTSGDRPQKSKDRTAVSCAQEPKLGERNFSFTSYLDESNRLLADGADLGGLTGQLGQLRRVPLESGDEQELEAVAAGPVGSGEDMP